MDTLQLGLKCSTHRHHCSEDHLCQVTLYRVDIREIVGDLKSNEPRLIIDSSLEGLIFIGAKSPLYRQFMQVRLLGVAGLDRTLTARQESEERTHER